MSFEKAGDGENCTGCFYKNVDKTCKLLCIESDIGKRIKLNLGEVNQRDVDENTSVKEVSQCLSEVLSSKDDVAFISTQANCMETPNS